jgi:hypothetical protein
MVYPNQSTARSGDVGSLWWFASYNGQDYVCASQGNTLLEQLQRTLKMIVPAVFGPPTGSAVPPLRVDQLEVDRKLGPKTLAALATAVRQLNGPQSLLDAINIDWANGSVNPNGILPSPYTSQNDGTPTQWGTTAAAIWVTSHRDLPFDALTIPPDIVTFLWSTEPPQDVAHGNAVCWKQGDPVPIEAGGGDATTPTVIPGGNTILGGAGSASNSSTSSWIQSVSTVFKGEGTTDQTLTVVGIGVGILAAGALAWFVATDKPGRRRSRIHRTSGKAKRK